MRIVKSVKLAAGLCALALVFSGAAEASGGHIVGWGQNSAGQLGNGTTSSGGCNCIPTPTEAKGVSTAVQYAADSGHVLALLADGTVMAWGGNADGQLGDGTTTFRSTPQPVPGVSGAIAVAAGDRHSLALLANGTVLAWGRNREGELGTGQYPGPGACNCRPTSAPVPGLSEIVAISAGRNYSLALRADGTVLMWGENSYGQNGTGAPTYANCGCVNPAQPVPGVNRAMALANGGEWGGALLADGTVKAWGLNRYGEMGRLPASPQPPCECLPVVSLPLSGVRAIGAGHHHGFAVLGSGALVTWGENYNGQLGNGTRNMVGCRCSTLPVPVALPHGVLAASGGAAHSVAALDDGSVMAWGENVESELGEPSSPTPRPTPGPVPGVAGASYASAATFTSYALIGPSQTLTVAFAGASTGAVGTDGLLCSSACSGKFPQSQTKVLRADSTAAGFAGWSGPCTGAGPCQVRLDSDQGVTATFGPPAGTAITQALVKSKQKKASFNFTAPGAITGYECKLIKPTKKKPKHAGKHGKAGASKAKGKGKKGGKKGGKKKAKKPQFSACATPTTYKNLKPGKYGFEVRALDILGADAVPAVKKFTIKKAKRHHKPSKGKH